MFLQKQILFISVMLWSGVVFSVCFGVFFSYFMFSNFSIFIFLGAFSLNRFQVSCYFAILASFVCLFHFLSCYFWHVTIRSCNSMFCRASIQLCLSSQLRCRSQLYSNESNTSYTHYVQMKIVVLSLHCVCFGNVLICIVFGLGFSCIYKGNRMMKKKFTQ